MERRWAVRHHSRAELSVEQLDLRWKAMKNTRAQISASSKEQLDFLGNFGTLVLIGTKLHQPMGRSASFEHAFRFKNASVFLFTAGEDSCF